MNRRRRFLALAGVSAFASSFASFAQPQAKVWRVGVLSVFLPGKDPLFDAFRQQLRDLGHVEGKTLAIEYLTAEGKYDRLPALAAELLKRNVDVIMAISGTPPANAARNAARTIPIVFTLVSDPVGQGLVTSLARPGGNVTGTSNLHPEKIGRAHV